VTRRDSGDWEDGYHRSRAHRASPSPVTRNPDNRDPGAEPGTGVWGGRGSEVLRELSRELDAKPSPTLMERHALTRAALLEAMALLASAFDYHSWASRRDDLGRVVSRHMLTLPHETDADGV